MVFKAPILLKKKFGSKVLTLSLIFLASLSVGFSLTRNSQDMSVETIILRNIMIREAGLYVLMGSKPMVEFRVDKDLPDHYHKKCIYKPLWESTKRELIKLSGPSYRFVSCNFGSEEQVFFISVPNMLVTLKLNYDFFAKEVGEDFEPEQLLIEIDDTNSFFWSKLYNNHVCRGLLFGYGKRNALLYEIGENYPVTVISDFEKRLSTYLKEDVQVDDLPLPHFGTFSLGDEVFEKYLKERRAIIKYLKKRNFEKTIKEWLAQQEESKIQIQRVL